MDASSLVIKHRLEELGLDQRAFAGRGVETRRRGRHAPFLPISTPGQKPVDFELGSPRFWPISKRWIGPARICPFRSRWWDSSYSRKVSFQCLCSLLSPLSRYGVISPAECNSLQERT